MSAFVHACRPIVAKATQAESTVVNATVAESTVDNTASSRDTLTGNEDDGEMERQECVMETESFSVIEKKEGDADVQPLEVAAGVLTETVVEKERERDGDKGDDTVTSELDTGGGGEIGNVDLREGERKEEEEEQQQQQQLQQQQQQQQRQQQQQQHTPDNVRASSGSEAIPAFSNADLEQSLAEFEIIEMPPALPDENTTQPELSLPLTTAHTPTNTSQGVYDIKWGEYTFDY